MEPLESSRRKPESSNNWHRPDSGFRLTTCQDRIRRNNDKRLCRSFLNNNRYSIEMLLHSAFKAGGFSQCRGGQFRNFNELRYLSNLAR